jgi:hypothetical protein
MGHLRLGTLPKTLKWNRVVGLLEESPDDSGLIAAATIQASRRELQMLRGDPSIGYCFWLLTRITWYARQSDFVERIQQIGIPIASSTSTFSFISGVSEHARQQCTRLGGSSIFREMAYLALKQTMSEITLTSANSLFGSSIANIQEACRANSSKKQFGIVSRRFFAGFLSQFLRYFVDKELSNHVGPGNRIENILAANDFGNALTAYAWQSSKIMEDFAAGWFAKRSWETEGDITTEDAQKFVAVALRKMQMEVGREDALL